MGLGSGETSLYKCSGPGEHISFLIFQEILSFFLPHSTNYTNAKFTESESTEVELGHRDFKTNSLGVFDVWLNIAALEIHFFLTDISLSANSNLGRINSRVGLNGYVEWSIRVLEKQFMKRQKRNSSKANTASFQFCSVSVRMGGA